MALSVGFGAIQVLRQRPHPNATKVLVNWLLTQRVQADIAKTVELNSRRLDVAPGAPEEIVDPQRPSDYVPHQFEQYISARRRAQQLAQELLR